MKRLVLLFLLIALPAVAQKVIRPSTADYRYDESSIGRLYLTNWYIDLHYANLAQGRTYQRQISEDGRWRFSGAQIVVPEVLGATASFTEGIDIRPIPPPIHFFRLTQDPTNAPTMRQQFDLVMKDQPVTGMMMFKKKRFKKEVVIKIPPHGVLKFTPKK